MKPVMGPAIKPMINSSRMEGNFRRHASHCARMPSIMIPESPSRFSVKFFHRVSSEVRTLMINIMAFI